MNSGLTYHLQDYCCLRMPAKPIEDLLELNSIINGLDTEDHEAVTAVLEKLFGDDFFREALFTASRELYKVFTELKAGNFQDKESSRKFLFTFYKYYSRMCCRATPYGLFAGVTSVTISEDPTNILFDEEKYRTACQLNIHSVTPVMRKIDPLNLMVRSKVKYLVNKTLYRLGEHIFFVEQFNNGRYLASNLSSIRLTEYVQAALDQAAKGATLDEIVEHIPNQSIDAEKKARFVTNLIQSQVLISEYWPSVSTEDYMNDFLGYLDKNGIDDASLAGLRTAHHAVAQVQRPGDINTLRQYVNNDTGDINKGDFFKINLFYNMQAQAINKKVLQEIAGMAYEISRFTEPRVSDSLNDFARAFYKKYEDNEVPLVQALDPNFGIGYGKVVNGFAEFTPLLEDVPVMSLPGAAAAPKADVFDPVYRSIMNRFLETKEQVINIEADIEKLYKDKERALPAGTEVNSAYIFGSILAASSTELDEGHFKFFPVQLYAPFASRMISRFAHGDKNMRAQLETIAKAEQAANPDVILAEVLTIPDDIYANVNLCPTIREYEIPYLSNSHLPRANQVNINDLLVSVKNGRVVLRSAKLGKEIIPCLSNTYNIELAQPIYKFLAAVSGQDVKFGEFWNWGAYNNEDHLPRVEYKKIILSRARWIIRSEKIDSKNDEKVKAFFTTFRNKYKVPRYVVLAQGDNELLIDLDNNICRSILIKEINKYPVLLFEHLFDPGNCFIKQDGKGFTNELLIPLGTNKPAYRQYYRDKKASEPVAKKIQKTFLPGSEWLYVKIYAGSKNVEKVLTETISDFAKELVAGEVIDKWFFLRYNDPDYHLRVRFHRHEKENNQGWYLLLERLQERLSLLIKEAYAVTMITDTYTREVERYGEHTMELSENIFYADSVAVANFLSLIYGDEGEVLRWKFAFVDVDSLLNDFGYDFEGKKRLMQKMSDRFLNEFSHNNRQQAMVLIKSMNNKYRKFRNEIDEVLMEYNATEIMEAYDCFKERSAMIKEDAAKTRNLAGDNIDDLLASYIHMSLNRLFLINQRRHELVVYYLLTKHYESVSAKSKKMIS